jgi:putative signal transducing protein
MKPTKEKNNKDDRVIKIFSGTLWEAELIKSMLSDANIKSFLKNSVINSYLYEPIMSDGVIIMVLESDSIKAKKIVEIYFNNK